MKDKYGKEWCGGSYANFDLLIDAEAERLIDKEFVVCGQCGRKLKAILNFPTFHNFGVPRHKAPE